MRKVIAAMLLTGAMLVACSLYVSEDATRIGPDAGPGDQHHGRRDAGLLDGGAPGDGPLDGGARRDAGPLDGGAPGDGPLPGSDGGPPGDGPLDGGAPGDGPLPGSDGGPPGDGPRPVTDGGPPGDGQHPGADGGLPYDGPRASEAVLPTQEIDPRPDRSSSMF